jgi:hypothetical protein
MDDTPKPMKDGLPAADPAGRNQEPSPEDGEIDWELTAMLDEGIWSADNERPVSAEELQRSTSRLRARLAAKRARSQ